VEDDMRLEAAYAAIDTAAIERPEGVGSRSAFACPSCGGVLWEATESELMRFRCRIRNAFGTETLVAEQGRSIEDALKAAMRALQERADLARRVAKRIRLGAPGTAARYDRIVAESELDALVIRRVLLDHDSPDG
jgi:two-component system chemotaxis response regulator CheB